MSLLCTWPTFDVSDDELFKQYNNMNAMDQLIDRAIYGFVEQLC